MSDKVLLHIPRLYADHHVKRVREILLGLNGVQDVFASSFERAVEVTYDPAQVQPGDMRRALEEAGYPEGEVIEFATALEEEQPKSAWFVLQQRILRANPVDRRMAGDFRKY